MCAQASPPGSRFCNACGQPLALAAQAAAPRFASPRVYTPPHLAETILTSRSALEGERKQVTVLFADMKGSLELLADRDPEEARQLLDPALERMMEAVHRYEGTVNQVLGDGLMALFGAPLAREDHATRACYAALSMQEAIRRYSEEARRAHGVTMQIRVGLNSGEVVVRTIDTDLHMEYSAIGQTTHLAARMEQLASPGSVLLTAATLRLAEGYVEVRSLGPVPVKGLAEPTETYELLGAGPARSRLQAGAARGLTRFVGRDVELSQLREALGRVRAGHGQIVALVGEPGVGKSRLVWEFTRSHRTEGCLTLESSSVSYGKATPYLPLADLLRGYCKIADRDDARAVREKVTGKVLILDEALRGTIPAVLSLLDALPEDSLFQTLDPAQRRERTLEALKRVLLREARVQPLLLVFEDLHWVDSETQAFLDDLVEGLPTARVLLLVNYRPEYRHGWGNRTGYRQIRLDPLPPETAEVLLRSLVGSGADLEPLKGILIARTEGNPFFLEESVRALVETKVLAGEQGAYRLAKALQAIQVPATVQAILAARIDRLSVEDKRVLQAASVIGKDLAFSLLFAVAELPESELRRALTHLQAAEFLYETSLFPELEYTFTHALTLEVAYGGLLQERRRALHASVVHALERLYPDRLAEQADRLVHHAFRGEVWGKALTYLRQVGAGESPPGPEAALGGGPESPAYLWWTGDYGRAITSGQRDLAVALDFRNPGGRVASQFRLGQVYHSLGDYSRALELLGRNVTALQGDLLHERFGMAGLPSVLSRAWLGWCLGERGELLQGIHAAEEALRIAEGADHPYSLIVAQFGIGTLYLLKGDLDQAIPVLERGLVLDRVTGIPLLLPFVAAPLGCAYARAGRVVEAERLLEHAVEQAVAMKLMANHSRRLAWLAEAHLLAGRPDRARELGERALDLAREHGERGHQAYALQLLGDVASGREPLDGAAARAAYQAAQALAEELGMRPLLGHCHLSRGVVHRRSGYPEEARTDLTAALEIFQSTEMTVWATRAEAEIARLL